MKKKVPNQKDKIDLFAVFANEARYEGDEYLIAVGGTVLKAKSPKELFIKYKQAVGLLN